MKNTFKIIVQNLQKYIPINIFRNGQETFYQKIRQAIIDGHRTMYIEGPTGMGKSFIQSTLSDAIINGSDIKILLLVPKITLLSQMKREFIKFASHLVLGIVGGGSKGHFRQVTVMTYQSFLNIPNENLLYYSVFFLDEAHKAMGEKTKAKIDEQEHAIIIGFTATSYYNEDKNLKDWLGLEVHKISIPEAVSVGMISSIQFIIGKVKIQIQDRSNFDSNEEYKRQMSKDIIRQGGNIAATQMYTKLFKKRGTRFIMFTVSVEQGFDLVRELRNAGIPAEIIHSETEDRDELFERFKNDEFKVLVGIDVIKEGFDDAGVHGVLFTYPINSTLGLIQGAGRATRIDELVPDKVAYIIQLMFHGKDQVWYSDVLGENSIILGPNSNSESNERIVTGLNLFGFEEDDLIESVEVESGEVFKLISEYNPQKTVKKKIDSFSEEELVRVAIQELAKHQITNRVSLMNLASYEFRKLNFGILGKPKSFLRLMLPEEHFTYITNELLEKLAMKLGWEDKVKTIENALIELKNNGIESRLDLLMFNVSKFKKTSFGVFGKGISLSSFILGYTVHSASHDVFMKIADKLGWENKTLNLAILELKKHNITSRADLIECAGRKFMGLSFGQFQKGLYFAHFLIEDKFRYVTNEVLEKIADKLGWD